MLVVAGTVIGAGMLAMPISSAQVGFSFTVLELGLFAIFMIIPALCYAEMAQFAGSGMSVSGLMRREFGFGGYALSNLFLYIFLYSLLCAYLAALTSIIGSLIGIPSTGTAHSLFVLGLTLPLGAIVIFTARIADLVNRVFFYLMVISFVVLVVVSVFKVDLNNLGSMPVSALAVLKSLPILFTVYGMHVVIPPLVSYLDRDIKALKISLIGGLLIPLVIFIVWNAVVHGLANQQALIDFSRKGDANVATLLASGEESGYVSPITTLFSLSAVLTSFIGVALALVSALRETFSYNIKELAQIDVASQDEQIETKLTPLTGYLLLFIIPVLSVLFVPQAFYFFLQFAAVFFAIQGLIFPILCTISFRKRRPDAYGQGTYKLALPNVALYFLAAVMFVIAMSTVL